MAITSGLFNSVMNEQGIEDRLYDAQWFALIFGTIIGNGVFPNPSNGLQVTQRTNMTTAVKTGRGWINGYFADNNGDLVLQHAVAHGTLKRIDRVVMRLNHVARHIEVVIKKGADASTPVAPTLQRDGDMYELALADVLINNGATQITQANITDQRLNTNLCGIVHGLVEQVDTTAIFNQYQSWFGAFTAEKRTDFDAWIASLQDILSGDVAANLASRITVLDQRFTQHLEDYVKHLANGGTTTGTTTAYTCNSSPNPVALRDKMGVVVTIHADSGANPTLNWGSLGAKAIRKPNGSAANIKKDGLYSLRYNLANDSFILQGEGGEYGTAEAQQVLQGYTVGRETGVVGGAMVNRGAINQTVTSQNQQIIIPAGYHDGSGKVTADITNLVASNIRRGVGVGGITGQLSTYQVMEGNTTQGSANDGGSVTFEMRIPHAISLLLGTATSYTAKAVFDSTNSGRGDTGNYPIAGHWNRDTKTMTITITNLSGSLTTGIAASYKIVIEV